MNDHCCCADGYVCPWCAPPTADDVDIEALAAHLFWPAT